MDTITASKRPAHLDVDRQTVERRLALVRQSLDCSAQCCADEADLCLRRFDMGEPFPGNGTVYVALPNSWLQAAAAWVFRGGQYTFGYRTPEGW